MFEGSTNRCTPNKTYNVATFNTDVAYALGIAHLTYECMFHECTICKKPSDKNSFTFIAMIVIFADVPFICLQHMDSST